MYSAYRLCLLLENIGMKMVQKRPQHVATLVCWWLCDVVVFRWNNTNFIRAVCAAAARHARSALQRVLWREAVNDGRNSRIFASASLFRDQSSICGLIFWGLLFQMRYTFIVFIPDDPPTPITLLDLVASIIIRKEQRSGSSSLCCFPHSPLSQSQILPSASCSHSHPHCLFGLSVRDQAATSHGIPRALRLAQPGVSTWRWKWLVPSKCWYPPIRPHGVATQESTARNLNATYLFKRFSGQKEGSFFFPDHFLPVDCRCRGYSCPWSHSITHTHTDARTIGRTPRDEGLGSGRYLYLTTQNTHNRQTSMPLAGFEPAIPASEQPQTTP